MNHTANSRPRSNARRIARAALAAMLVPALAWAQEAQRAHDMVVNGEMKAEIGSGRGAETVSGRVSAHLQFTAESLERGIVVVRALNWVAFGVGQQAITGREPKGKATSPLGFTLAPGEVQTLKLDGRSLGGTVKGQLDLAQFYEIAPQRFKDDTHDIDMTTLPAVLELSLNFDRALARPDDVGEQGVETRKAEARIEIRAQPYDRLGLRRELRVASRADLVFEIDWVLYFEAARRLCIQPVRVRRLFVRKLEPFPFAFPITPLLLQSGDGLAFGQPGVTEQWNKADIQFTYRDWMDVWDWSYLVLTEAEMTSLRDEVDVDDCVEAFFVNAFDPQDTDGGGNTVNGGTASAKVVSSDENADFGIDLTHLAHEFGHVLTLKHPGQGFPTAAVPHRVDGNSNTLMCGSGFANDNPRRNSRGNADNAANPLLTFSLKAISPGPDCDDDADCGACP